MTTYSIVQKSQLEGVHRLDAEYYQPYFLELTKNLNRLEAIPIRELAIIPTRNFIPRNDESFHYLEISGVDTETGEYVTSEVLGKNAPNRARWVIQKNDIITSTVRPIRGITSLITKNTESLVCSSGFAVLKPKSIESEYLFIYLKSKPIIKLLDRLTTATMYPAITIDDVLNTKIYLGNKHYRQKIVDKVHIAQEKLQTSKSLYSQAKNLLLEELGLKDFEPEDKLSYSVNLSDVKSSHRSDAEYFQPIYVKFEKLMLNFEQKMLSELCTKINYGTVPTSPYTNEGIPYIKGLNLSNSFIDKTNLDHLDGNSTKGLNKKFFVKPGDVIISQMGTVGKASVITEEEENWLFASFTIRVRPEQKLINPIYLTLYINLVGRPYYLLRKIAQASVRQNTDLPTVRTMRIPLLPPEAQQKIANLVRQSHASHKKAKELLNQAKTQVEELIEQTT